MRRASVQAIGDGRLILVVLACLVVGACETGDPASNANAAAGAAQPRPGVPAPSAQVTIDGANAAPLDAARLAAIPATYTRDDGTRAWRLDALLATYGVEAGARVTLHTAQAGTATVIDLALLPADRAAVLTLNRRGQFVIGVVPRDAPFPAFHGRGGNRQHGGGDPASLRVRGVQRLVVQSPGRSR